MNHVRSVYIHWPFCAKLCNYCNFNKYVNQDVDFVRRMGDCLLREASFLARHARVTDVETIYFGGGTPSLMPPALVKSVITSVLERTKTTTPKEVTLEVNPNPNVNSDLLEEFIEAGVNRFSIGIQALDDRVLKWMNRDHDVKSAVKLLEDLAGLQTRLTATISVDLMFGRPRQTTLDWLKELDALFGQSCFLPHISLYELTVEKGTPLEKEIRRGEVSLPSEDERTSMYLSTVEALASRGLHRYEISNFSCDIQHQSRHNCQYWYGGNFLGLGPGAHGRYYVDGRRHATVQTPSPWQWIKEVENKGHGTRKSVRQSHLDILAELLATSLRTTRGLEARLWQQMTAADGFSPSLVELCQDNVVLESMMAEGRILCSEDRLVLSDSGLIMADYIVPYLLSNLEKKM